MFKTQKTTRTLVLLSVLAALQIILARFCSFNAWNVRIGLGFIPVALAGIFFGPLPAALVAAVSDFLGAILFPTGTYFPGFTLTAACTGLSFGFLLHNKLQLPRILLAVGLNQLLMSLCMNTLWISVLYGSSFTGLLSTRALQVIVIAPIQIMILTALSGVLKRADLQKVFAA